MIIGGTTQVSFKLDILGSTDSPKVRVALECSPEFVYYAHRTGELWTADINIPVTVSPGTYKLRIEVILGNRLFTPISKMVDVSQPEISAVMSAAPETASQAVPAEIEASSIPPEAQVEITPPVGLIRQFESEDTAKSESKKPVQEKRPEKKTIQLPPDLFSSLLADATPKQKVQLPTKPIITKKDTAIAESKKVEKKKWHQQIVEIKQETPVVLVKGDIVFE